MLSLENARVVVVGGAGFIGSHVTEQLLEEQVREIVVLDNFARGSRANLEPAVADSRLKIVQGSIADTDLLRRTLEGADFVFHLAALWLHECVHHPRDAVEINALGTFNVAEAAVETGVRKVVYSSSASVYGDAREIPMTEDHPFDNRTLYGATKIAGEQFFRAFNERHGLDWVGLRYMNVYGPRMDYKGTYVSVIMKILDQLDAGEPPILFGDGRQAYDFVHVEDVARANVLALRSDVTDALYNVGTGTKTTINELTELLLELTGSSLRPEYRPEEQMFVTHRVGSTELAAAELGFTARVGLRAGLRSVIDWRNRDRSQTALAEVP